MILSVFRRGPIKTFGPCQRTIAHCDFHLSLSGFDACHFAFRHDQDAATFRTATRAENPRAHERAVLQRKETFGRSSSLGVNIAGWIASTQ